MIISNLFSYSFRPFFLLGTLYALLAMIFWILAWTQLIEVQWQSFPPYWHGHEMLVGLVGAAIAGFLLTAVANWTKRPPVSGLALALLCMLWISARVSSFSPLLSAVTDLGFWSGLWLLLANEIFRAGNRRNYKILLLLALIAGVDACYHLAELNNRPILQGQFLWGLLWLIILLINVIGGRVIPAFTANWLRQQHAPSRIPENELPPNFNGIDMLAVVALCLFALATLINLPDVLAIALGCIAAFLQFWRLLRWRFWKVLSDPLVWMMHLAYFWIPVGLVLWTISLAGLVPVSIAVHALTIGAIASMIISIASRAALGHTGRALQSHPLLTGAIVLLSASVVLRIVASMTASQVVLMCSAAAWILAFLLFAVRYVPILLLPPAAIANS